MDHIAILERKRKLLEKIISGDKTIESRWYQTRRAPWHAIAQDDTIYFKDAGEPVTAKATVDEVLFFDGLDRKKIENILRKYGKAIGLTDLKYNHKYDKKRYCMLMFLKDAQEIEPFYIDKTGFGNAAAWMTVKDIRNAKI